MAWRGKRGIWKINAASRGSRFSDLKVQSDPRVDDKVQCGFAAVQGSKFNAAKPRFKVKGSRLRIKKIWIFKNVSPST